MAHLHLRKSKKILMPVLALIVVISTIVASVAVFTDRVNRTTTIQVSTFNDDGYTIQRSAPDGYFTAGETVEATLKEGNKKSDNITSKMTMTVEWESPVPDVYPWGNISLNNATITLDGETVPYTVNSDQTITFTLPEKELSANTTDITSSLKFQIPSDLASTGKLCFNFDRIELGYASWTTSYNNTELESLDFNVSVAWNISKDQTTAAGNPNRDVIAVLTEGSATGQYGLEIIKNGSDDNTNNGQMMDWSAKDQTPWASYAITDLSMDEGVTSVGDYAFAGETGIISLDFPSTMTGIGTSAFDGIGLSGEFVIPGSIEKIESLAFGNLPNVTTITFEHTSDDNLSLPNNTSTGKKTSGAFYVPTYVKTTFDFNGNSDAEKYNWVNDNRMKVGITGADLSYDNVVVGQTVTPVLVITPNDCDDYQSIYYEVIKGDDYAKVLDSTTGVVEGLAQGEAIVQVTIVDANGNTVITTATVTVLGIGVTSASLEYDSVVVGQTVDPELDLLPESHGPVQSTLYEIVDGNTFIELLDNTTGVVKGLAQGEATVKVTVTDTNGDTVTDTATVKVLGIGVTSASLEYDSVVVGQTVNPDLDLLPESHGPVQSTLYEIVDGDAFIELLDNTTGVVKGLAQGEATVKVTVTDTNGDTVTDTATVKVLGIGVTSASLEYDSVVVGQTVNPDLDLLPESHGPVQSTLYEIVDGDVFIELLDNTTGVVKGLAQGEATVKVTVTDTNGDTVTDTATVKVLGIGITSASLEYDSVVVGQTVNPDLDLLPESHGPVQSTLYEIVDGDVFIELLDNTTGVVKGLAQGEATVKVTVTDTNGDTVTDTATVKVLGIGITSASLEYDSVVVGQTVNPDLDLLPESHGPVQSTLYEIVDGDVFIELLDNTTGVVKGLAQGEATVKVTVTDTNGDTVTDTATVTVTANNFVPMLAASNTWFTPNESAITKSTISSVTLMNSYTPTGTLVDSWPAAVDENGDGILDSDIIAYAEDDGLGNGTYKLTIAGNGNPSGIFYANEDSSRAFWLFSAMTSFNNSSVMDTSKVKYMGHSMYSNYGMFQGCDSLTSLDLSSWDTSKVLSTISLFYSCDNLKDLNISGWDMSSCKRMVYMFSKCLALETVDIGNWNTSNVIDMSGMFEDSTAINYLDVATKEVTVDGETYIAWNVGMVEDMGSMFRNCEALPTLDVSNWDVGLVEDMLNLFCGCDIIDDLDVSKWNTENVSDFRSTFSGCNALSSLDVSNWNTESATTMGGMFSGCESLPTLNVTSWNVSLVDDMGGMFSGCDIINGMDMSKWDTSSVTDMHGMFSMCYALVDPTVQNFDTSKVEDMEAMFYQCHAIKTLDLSNWVTSSVTTMAQDGTYNGMFYECHNLTTIYATHRFDVTNVTESDYMFGECLKLVGGAGTEYYIANDDKAYAHVDGGTSNPGYFTNNIFLAYDNVVVDETVPAQLTIKSTVFENYTSCEYTVVDGDTYASVAADGTVTGLAEGIATIQVTLGAANGDTITAQALVTVTKPIPILASQTSWYTQGGTLTDGTAVAKSSITSIEFSDSTAPSSYVGKWDASDGQVGTVTAYLTDDGSGNGTYKLDVVGNGYGKIFANKISYHTFYGFENVTSISGLTTNGAAFLDTSNTTDMRGMFDSCKKLTTFDISKFDTSRVTAMAFMFSNCQSITSLDLTNFDTTNVSQMYQMFQYCSALTDLDISSFDTGKNTNMFAMFMNCTSLPSLDLTNFNTASVTSMYYTFFGCTNLKTIDIDTTKFNTGNVSNMASMFQNCYSLSSIDMSKFDTSSCTDMRAMFSDCYSLSSLNISSFDTQNVKYMTNMFFKCSGLTNLDVTGFNTKSVQEMGSMFSGCTGLTSLDVTNWDTSSTTDMDFLFSECTGLTSLDVTSFDTSSVTTMQGTFSTLNITSLDLSNFDTSNVTNMDEMFWYCTSLKTIYATDAFNTDKVTDSERMFVACVNLVGGAGTTFDDNYRDKTYARIDGGTSNPGYFTNNTILTADDAGVSFMSIFDGSEDTATDAPTTDAPDEDQGSNVAEDEDGNDNTDTDSDSDSTNEPDTSENAETKASDPDDPDANQNIDSTPSASEESETETPSTNGSEENQGSNSENGDDIVISDGETASDNTPEPDTSEEPEAEDPASNAPMQT